MKKTKRSRYEWYYDSIFYVIKHFKECRENKRLCEKYPWLLPRDRWTDKKHKHYHYQWTELDLMPNGWRKAFGEIMMEDILEACIKDKVDPDCVRVLDLKEKWGSLRMDLNVYGFNIYRVLDSYEEVSRHVCLNCGKIDVPQTDFGWVLPECRDCHIKRFGDAKRYDKMYDEIDFLDCIIPNHYIAHTSHGEKKIDLTWITKRLRGNTNDLS